MIMSLMNLPGMFTVLHVCLHRLMHVWMVFLAENNIYTCYVSFFMFSYYYSSSLGYYYDPSSGLYCCAASGQW